MVTADAELDSPAGRDGLFSPRHSAVFFLAGVAAPQLSGLVAFRLVDPPVWQSGLPCDYARLLASPDAIAAMTPFFLISAVCGLLTFWNPTTAISYLIVRLGVYGGILLYFHAFLVNATMVNEVGLPDRGTWWSVSILGCVLTAIMAVLWRLPYSVQLFAATLTTILGGLVIGANVFLGSIGGGPADRPGSPWPLTSFVFACVSVAAMWAYVEVARAIWKLRGRTYSLGSLMGLTGWLATYFAIVRRVFDDAEVRYAQLPTTPPPPQDCFIVTAATQGHPWIVGSHEVRCIGGGRRRINRQLQTLKFAELTLAAAFPSWHRRLRRVYNRLGPRLARRLHSPWRADLAYCLLKPAEWLAAAGLRRLIPGFDRRVARLYTSPELPVQESASANTELRSTG